MDLSDSLARLANLKPLTPNQYQQQALSTEKTPKFVNTGDHCSIDDQQMSRLLHGLIGLCTEAGEAQDMVKKVLIYGKILDRVNVMEEVGDILWYCALVLDSAGFTMEHCMERNLAKLRARYNGQFTHEKALVRDTVAERQILESFDAGDFAKGQASNPPE